MRAQRNDEIGMAIIALSGLKSWDTFAVLIMTAIALRYAEGPILVIAAIVAFVAAWFMFGFMRGIARRRQRMAAMVNDRLYIRA